MTIRYTLKCDLCGREHELGYSRELNTEARSFEKPDGWGMFQYTTYTNPTSGVTMRLNVMVCPVCNKALADGVDIITADQRQKEAELAEAVKEAGHVPIISMMPKSIPCNDVYGVSEEEASR